MKDDILYGPLYTAIHKAQREIPAMVKSATNPHFRSSYIPLEDLVEKVNPALANNDLLWITMPCLTTTGEPGLFYKLRHVPSGEEISATMPLLLDKQNSQGMGSAITYARRYALTSVFNIIADVDDDGNKASAPPTKKAEEKPASFTDQVRATGKKAAEIREWAASEGYTLDDVGVDAKGLTAFLNGLQPARREALLRWAGA